MSDFVIRKPKAEEAEELADLHLRCWQETYSGQFPDSAWNEEARSQRLRMWQFLCTTPRPDQRIAVAEQAGKLIGFAGVGENRAESEPTKLELYFIYLLASQQGSGAGQALLDSVLGSEPASLWVLEDNPRSRAFYEKNGFVLDGTRQETGYETGGDEVRMVRQKTVE